jgi:uncharacterized protein YndB with AHSA1/START domain
MNNTKSVTIKTSVNATLEMVWASWTLPQHITHWNFASSDWHCPSSTIDLKIGGRFSSRMEAKDGSFGFDFWGIYDEIVPRSLLSITLGDGRKMEVRFTQNENNVLVTESFETEDQNTTDRQREGWQAILDNYKSYTETL